MQITTKELEAALLKLPVEDRIRLLDKLLASLEPESAVQETWLQLARQRREDVRAGKVAMDPGETALARVRTRIT